MRCALVLAAATAASLLACGDAPSRLSAEDEREIRALERAYVDAWLRDDTAGVLATLSPDVVLMPGGGRRIEGLEAARKFWWPDDGSRTRVTAYTTTIDEVGGSASLAYVRGTGALSFTYERDTVRLEQTSRNTTLTVVTRGPGDAWRIRRRMWAPLGP